MSDSANDAIDANDSANDDSYKQDDDLQSFVKVVENDETDEFVELPVESDDTLLISTLQGQFPSAVGIRYKSSTGGWRGVRISGDVLNPPHGGWGDTSYCVTLSKEAGSKRKVEEGSKVKEEIKKKKADIEDDKFSNSAGRHLLQDMIVLSLPFHCKDSDLKEYFTNACGDMSLHEVKFDRQTKKSRGFGFIRFRTVEGAKAALTGEHSILGRTVEIRLSKRKEDPMKLFIGRIPDGTTVDELKVYFSDFGEVKDAYIPTPFRGFGFVTYLYSDDGRAALRRSHKMVGVKLNVQFAEPKEEKMARRRRAEEDIRDTRDIREPARGNARGYDNNPYQMESRDSRRGYDGREAVRDYRDARDTREPSRRYNDYDQQRGDYRNQYDMDPRDTASELKNMLYSILSGGGR